MFTAIVTAIIVAATITLAGCAWVMVYAKNCTDEERESMGVRF